MSGMCGEWKQGGARVSHLGAWSQRALASKKASWRSVVEGMWTSAYGRAFRGRPHRLAVCRALADALARGDFGPSRGAFQADDSRCSSSSSSPLPPPPRLLRRLPPPSASAAPARPAVGEGMLYSQPCVRYLLVLVCATFPPLLCLKGEVVKVGGRRKTGILFLLKAPPGRPPAGGCAR